jgi:hypothetical protein
VKIRVAVCIGLAIVTTRVGAQSWTRQAGDDGFHVGLDAAGRYGPVDGFLQTPLGGSPGTTSHRRPSFNELGIDTVASADAALTLGWGDHALVAGGSVSRLSGDSVLNRSLISENTSYPAGDSVSSDVQLDWYRAGYQYRLRFVNQHGAALDLEPEIGIALFDFDYRLRATGGLSTSRAYLKGGPEVGMRAEWTPGGRFSVSAAARGAIPEPTGLGIISAQITGNYQLWGKPDHGGQAFLGLGYELIDFEDNQKVPNHIHAESVPLGLLGVRVRF